ncbi:hypothetical protein J6590_072390 [Homalodisca vitripennis]|nr:hypothetical protein J6590_072390 [Homalodisca vitripennis]
MLVQACLLLSLENLYPAAHQLALDMLQRLSTANQEITEVLLSKCQILPALSDRKSFNYVKAIGGFLTFPSSSVTKHSDTTFQDLQSFPQVSLNCVDVDRYAMESGTEDQLSSRKFLELAQAADDKQLFYSVAAYFETRNTGVNGSVTPFR